ncbi:hypothetical protein [Sphingosinicella sp. BN140058]|uniref:hypothetical protein n=1 Tax=Sphingosinicella sp. BN140058 TaxID=1892855 RepID=UPI001011DE66|nr:hypothetical protein [Sphingosinicella sp. BN140058]QAY75763.1 hypothetical protein ETR14_03870 [Sphingosinicella sp. BN140058]
MTHLRRLMAAFWLTVGLSAAGAAHAQSIGDASVAASPVAPSTIVQRPAEALAQDAAEYARQHQVPLDVAIRRLLAQEDSVVVTDEIRSIYAARLAGIAIEHAPIYRVVVLLTGAEPVPNRVIRAGGMDVPIVFRTGAPATGEQIVEAVRLHAAEVRAQLPSAVGMGLDPRTGEFVLMVRRADADRYGVGEIERRLKEGLRLPARVRVLDGADRNSSIEGGARLEGLDAVTGNRGYCTTGFVVTNGTETGIVTAAHCPDSATYFDPAGGRTELAFGGQWGWSFQDVQLHVSALAQKPLFYADTKKSTARPLVASRKRSSTRAGDFVCHRGERSGYSCAEVELVDYAPPGDLCGGPCAPVWVTVSGPSCGGGDSGGPVFTGGTAFGIVKGASYDRRGRCNFYYYMSTDYLPDGWSLLTEQPPQSRPVHSRASSGGTSPGSAITARR